MLLLFLWFLKICLYQWSITCLRADLMVSMFVRLNDPLNCELFWSYQHSKFQFRINCFNSLSQTMKLARCHTVNLHREVFSCRELNYLIFNGWFVERDTNQTSHLIFIQLTAIYSCSTVWLEQNMILFVIKGSRSYLSIL